ncbi:MAG: enoyl-CoA hydratase/isomerase family protein [Thermomicrobiales bacterium]
MSADITTHGAVAVITMSRPEALNAFDIEQIQAVIDAFKDVGRRPDIRAVVLTGEGERAFAAGADIKYMMNLDGDSGLAFGRWGHRLTGAIEQARQPVIAAVNGFALGGGCEVAIAADIRFASPNAVFAQPEVSLGIPPGWGGTQRLPRLVGPGLAAEMILSGRRVDAEEALRIGLVNAIFAQEELLPRSIELASQIAANSPRAVRAARDLMRLAFNGETTSGLAAEAELFGEAFAGPDPGEGMRAFIEKRKPVFADS